VEQSYDTLGDSNSDENESEDLEEEVNGEVIRGQIEGFKTSQMIQAAVSGVAFVMSVVGIWGDGA